MTRFARRQRPLPVPGIRPLRRYRPALHLRPTAGVLVILPALLVLVTP